MNTKDLSVEVHPGHICISARRPSGDLLKIKYIGYGRTASIAQFKRDFSARETSELRLKQLVRYQPKTVVLSARFGRKSYMRTAAQLTAIGAGDCTVREDGVTVRVSREHMERIRPCV